MWKNLPPTPGWQFWVNSGIDAVLAEALSKPILKTLLVNLYSCRTFKRTRAMFRAVCASSKTRKAKTRLCNWKRWSTQWQVTPMYEWCCQWSVQMSLQIETCKSWFLLKYSINSFLRVLYRLSIFLLTVFRLIPCHAGWTFCVINLLKHKRYEKL